MHAYVAAINFVSVCCDTYSRYVLPYPCAQHVRGSQWEEEQTIDC